MFNVPLQARAGDRTYMRVMEKIIQPAIELFRPQILFVSAGFDAHWNDPLTSLGLSTGGFFAFSRKLVELANEHCHRKIVFVLEGGYEPRNVANGCAAVFAALEEKSLRSEADDPSPHPDPDHSARIEEILAWHGMG